MPPAKTKAAHSVPMTAQGAAPNTVAAKGNHVRIGNMFLAHIAEGSPDLSAKWGEDWETVPEEYACNQEIFEHMANYLVFTYTIASGDKNAEKQHLADTTAKQVWASLIQQAKTRFSRSTKDATKVRRTRVHP